MTAGEAAVAATAAPCTVPFVVPALTSVTLELLAPLGSKLSKSGDNFPIRLAEPIVVDGQVLIPAGALGIGEVVHAKKAGGSGAPGELVLAARYLDVCGRRLRLRSMHVSSTGRSKVNAVNTINLASAASPLPVGLVGFLIRGGQVNVPQGTFADAKTAEIFMLASAPDTGSSGAQQAP